MRRIPSLIFLVLSMAGFVQAQIVGVIGTIPQDLLEGTGPAVLPTILPIVPISSHSYSSSAFDHDGNLLILDIIYSSSPLALPGQPVILRLPGTTKTRITVISSAGTRLASREYDGSIQIVATGRNAVYAFLTTYSTITTTTDTTVAGLPRPITSTRTLVSLRVGAGGLPASLPGVEVPARADVKISAADVAGGLDSIAFVDTVSPVRILLPSGTTTAVEPRSVRIHKSDGNSFIAVTANPIPLP